jgi:DNA-binding PadR family transcriptional regulator
MSRQAMNYLLGDLEKLGYLVRLDDPEDKRSRRIELTERGYEARRIMWESAAGIEADLERELGRSELAQLRQLLVALNCSAFLRNFRKETGQPEVIVPKSAGAISRTRKLAKATGSKDRNSPRRT